MSLQKYLKPLLYQTSDDNQWYLKATTDALNEYLNELVSILSKPCIMVSGVTTVPGTPPIPTPITGNLAYFVPSLQKLTFEEVKTAMWCGDGKQCFINLFNLFGTKFCNTFKILNASPVLNASGMAILLPSTFGTCAINMLSEAAAIGSEINPDKFLELESRYLSLAIATIPPQIVPLVGVGLIPSGLWTGNATVNFSLLGL